MDMTGGSAIPESAHEALLHSRSSLTAQDAHTYRSVCRVADLFVSTLAVAALLLASFFFQGTEDSDRDLECVEFMSMTRI